MKPVRSFTALDIIRLPRLDAIDAHSLGQAVVAAAEGQPLSDGAKETYGEVSVALRLLGDALKNRLPRAEATGSATREADTKLDAAWSATYDFLDAWAKLPDEPKAATAAHIRERLFPDGLRFTKVQFTRQWTESDSRLSLLDEENLEKGFQALGGVAFVQAIRDKHKVYGEVLGLTKAREEPAEEQKIRDALDRLTEALRVYVLQVSAMERKSDPNSKKLVEKLLAPLATWQSRPAASNSAPTADEAPNPQAEPPVEKGSGDC